MFKTTFSFSIFLAFRSSELIAESKQDSSSRTLAVTEVSNKASKLHVHLRRSKTDHHVWRVNILLHSSPRGMLCPVHYTREYLSVRPQIMGLLIVHADGMHLSWFQFISVFQACLSKAGFLSGFGTHSFQISWQRPCQSWASLWI